MVPTMQIPTTQTWNPALNAGVNGHGRAADLFGAVPGAAITFVANPAVAQQIAGTPDIAGINACFATGIQQPINAFGATYGGYPIQSINPYVAMNPLAYGTFGGINTNPWLAFNGINPMVNNPLMTFGQIPAGAFVNPLGLQTVNPYIAQTINPFVGTYNPYATQFTGTFAQTTNPYVAQTFNPYVTQTFNPNITGTVNPFVGQPVNPFVNGCCTPTTIGGIPTQAVGTINPLVNNGLNTTCTTGQTVQNPVTTNGSTNGVTATVPTTGLPINTTVNPTLNPAAVQQWHNIARQNYAAMTLQPTTFGFNLPQITTIIDPTSGLPINVQTVNTIGSVSPFCGSGSFPFFGGYNAYHGITNTNPFNTLVSNLNGYNPLATQHVFNPNLGNHWNLGNNWSNGVSPAYWSSLNNWNAWNPWNNTGYNTIQWSGLRNNWIWPNTGFVNPLTAGYCGC